MRRRRPPLGVALLVVGALALALWLAARAEDPAPATAAGDPAPAAAPVAPAAARCTPPRAGDHRVRVDPDRIPVVLHVPPGRAAGRRPLVLVLHGAGQTWRDMADYTGYSRLADRRGFLVAYPSATGSRPFWNISTTQSGKPDDVAYLRRVIAALTGGAGCADPARVGVTGVSNGGGMSALLACRAADLLAAAAPVAGGYRSLPGCRPSRPLPVLEIHGLRDRVVPYAGRPPDHAGAVQRFLREWRRRDGCTTAAARSAPAPSVEELRWSCAGGRKVVHDRVLDADHGWPGEASLRPFSSTLRTWRFLAGFRNDDVTGR